MALPLAVVLGKVGLLLLRQQGPVRAALQELSRRGLKFIEMNQFREALVATNNWTATMAKEFGEICGIIFGQINFDSLNNLIRYFNKFLK